MGIKAAERRIQDVGFDIQRARLERMPATLTAGGRFAWAVSSSRSTVSPTPPRSPAGSQRS